MSEADIKNDEDREAGGNAHLLEIGTVVDGKYLITGYLGRGGMGSVYRARHGNLGNEVALKTMHWHCVTDANSVTRFRREAHIISELRHRNILSVYAFGEWDGLQYIAMEFIKGNSLRDYIVDRVSLSPSEAMPYLVQICDAMTHAHTHGVLHRDLKPDNVLVEIDSAGNQTVKVVDFGLAQLLSDAEMQRLTRTGMVVGDPHYMSPEQAQGLQLDTRSDIYAFGCLMYEVLSGEKPFDGDTAVATLFKQVSAEPVPFAEKLGLPSALEAIAFKAMEKKPDDRYASFEELAAQIRLVEANPSIKIERKHRPSPFFVFLNRYGVIALMPILIVAVIMSFLFIGTKRGTNVDEEAQQIKLKETTLRVRQIINNAGSAIRDRNYVKAQRYVDEALSLNEQMPLDALTRAQIYNYAGLIAVENGERSKDKLWAQRALVLLQRALKEFNNARDAELKGSRATIALVQLQLNRINSGELEAYANILVAAEAAGDNVLHERAAHHLLEFCEFDPTHLAREHQEYLVLKSFECLFNANAQSKPAEAKKLLDRELAYLKRRNFPAQRVSQETDWMFAKLDRAEKN